MKLKLVFSLFCIIFYPRYTSSTNEEESCEDSALKKNARNVDIDENILIVFFQLRDQIQAVIQKVDQIGAKLAERIENLENNIETIDRNTRKEISDIRTKLDTVKSIPSSIEKLLENYKIPGEEVNNSGTQLKQLRSCLEIKRENNKSKSGVYKLYPYNDNENITRRSVNAYCDMETTGGGWTVFQRRGIPGNLTEDERSDLFNQTWDGYKNGFGEPSNDYWLGLDTIHELTKECNHELLITATHLNGTLYQAHYSTVRVASEADKFKLIVGGYVGGNSTLADDWNYHDGLSFSTIDRDNDEQQGSCSVNLKANGFWFKSCFRVSLNGMYPSSRHPDTMSTSSDKGIVWKAPVLWLKLKTTEMKIRAQGFGWKSKKCDLPVSFLS